MKMSKAVLSLVVIGVTGACGPSLQDDGSDEIEESLSGTNFIKVVSSGLNLDVSGASLTNGAPVIQWSFNGAKNQQWTLKSVGTNIFNIVSVNSGKCMDVSGGSTSNGASVVQWTCHTGNNQRFEAKSHPKGGYRLVARHSGKCLDIAGASLTRGAKLQQWTCHDGANQAFKFSSVSSTTTTTTTTSSTTGGSLTWRKANLTNFTSYPDPGSEECIQFNGCMWAGQFAFVDGQQSEQWVKDHNIIAVHEKDAGTYKLKTLRLKQGTHQIDAKVYDMCSDSDCSGCCTDNARETGFLIDIEKYTMQRFGSGDGIVDWACLDCN
jgi:hypothetical protein